MANVIQSSDDGESFDSISDSSSVGNDPVATTGVRSGTSHPRAALAAAVSELVMCRPWLGPKAPALAWLEPALA